MVEILLHTVRISIRSHILFMEPLPLYRTDCLHSHALVITLELLPHKMGACANRELNGVFIRR